MQEREDYNLNEVMETAMLAGRIMLENGAEIYRVEDTMRRIAANYGVEEKDFFVLTNGIFSSAETKSHGFTKINYIPVKGADLAKVEAVNKLSREMVSEAYSVGELHRRLLEANRGGTYPGWAMLVAYILATWCFCILFGGKGLDSVVAAASGIVLYFFQKFVSSKHFSKITAGILNGAVTTAVCLLLHYTMGLGGNLRAIIGGGVIVLVPGVAFVNGIRDIGDGDYLSGTVRLLDAIVAFASIAIGVGFMFSVFTHLSLGGAL